MKPLPPWKPADILWIQPPFGLVDYPSLGLHTLQAVASAEGFSSYVFYANQSFAALVGPEYADLCGMNYFLLGERVFSKAAWGEEVPTAFPDGLYDYPGHFGHDTNPLRWLPAKADPPVEQLRRIEAAAGAWVDALAGSFDDLPYSMVGVSVNFEQTNVALALLRRIKERNPRITTLIGGFSCEDDGADGLASLDPEGRVVDHFFSGESEHTLTAFLRATKAGRPLTDRIFRGKPLQNLDEVPFLEFDDYFDQLGHWFPEMRADTANLTLVGETSRGCWWGQKSHCLFCGYEERLCFREKTPRRFLEELDRLKKWNIKKFCLADLIMPHRYFDTLLPDLARRNEGWVFYYEQRAAWDHKKLDLLVRAGVTEIQPGIETLSDTLLEFMGKGNTLRQNLRFLRDSTAADLKVFWNVVWGFPGEASAEYAAMADLVPLLTHLTPPMGLFLLTLVKFSAFWRSPGKYGLTNLRPARSYDDVFPKGCRVDQLAVIFAADYPSETLADPRDVDRFADAVEAWNQRWGSYLFRPRLQVSDQPDGSYVLVDTRGLPGTEPKTPLDAARLKVLWDDEPYTGSEAQTWALDRKAALRRNDRVVSLALIPPELRRKIGEPT